MDALYRDILWGSQGGLRYRIAPPKLLTAGRPGTRWVVATEDGRAVGCASLTPLSDGRTDLGGNFVVASGTQGKGIGRALASWMAEHRTRPLLVTIESDNDRSLACLLGVGGTPLQRLEATLCTRRWPRAWSEARRGELTEVAPVARPLLDQVAPDHVFTGPGCGALFVGHEWEVTTMGGPLGRALLPLLPLFGVHPARFRFVSAHAWWGEPAALDRLFDHVLHTTHSQAVVCMAATGTPAHATQMALRRGLAGRAVGVSTWEVFGSPDAHWDVVEPVAVL